MRTSFIVDRRDELSSMFRRDRQSSALIDSLVQRAARASRGTSQFSGGLHLDGSVAGNVQATGEAPSRLVISESAVIEGSVVADVVELHGTVRGDIQARGRVALGPGARVEGNLHYGAIEMAAGAHIKGKLVKLGNEAGLMSDENIILHRRGGDQGRRADP